VAGPGRELSLARFEEIALSALGERQRDAVLSILELFKPKFPLGNGRMGVATAGGMEVSACLPVVCLLGM
jgi:hypothetical protein